MPDCRQLMTAGVAGFFLLGAILAGVVGGARVGAEVWSIDGIVLPLCAPGAGHTAPNTPASHHSDHGICALCVATGCVAGLAAAPLAAPLPRIVRVAAAVVRRGREPLLARRINWNARPRAPPGVA
jgi:hypothetical protein